MKPPAFLIEWIERMPYHQIAELTDWMDKQSDLKLAIETEIGKTLGPSEEDYYGFFSDNGNQGS